MLRLLSWCRLVKVEHAVLDGQGCVVRLAGLYHAQVDTMTSQSLCRQMLMLPPCNVRFRMEDCEIHDRASAVSSAEALEHIAVGMAWVAQWVLPSAWMDSLLYSCAVQLLWRMHLLT